jgi:hypothetical protein
MGWTGELTGFVPEPASLPAPAPVEPSAFVRGGRWPVSSLRAALMRLVSQLSLLTGRDSGSGWQLSMKAWTSAARQCDALPILTAFAKRPSRIRA